MNIVMYCVFGITLHSTGVVRTQAIWVVPRFYNDMKYEAGQDQKQKVCREIFGEEPDLAWSQDAPQKPPQDAPEQQ